MPIRWKLNGNPLPRNPDDVQWPMVKANVAYEVMLDGSQRRLTLPNQFQGRDVKLSWKSADARMRNALWSALISSTIDTIVLDGTQPLVQLKMNFDDMTKDQISSQVYDPRAGQGGTRRDIEISGRSEPFFRAVNAVPGGNAIGVVNLATDTNFASIGKGWQEWGNNPNGGQIGTGNVGYAASAGVGPGGSTGMVLQGSGGVINRWLLNDPTPVIPGQWYLIRGYINAANCTGANKPFVSIYDAPGINGLAIPAFATNGASGTVQTYWQCPVSGVVSSAVRLILHSNNTTVASGSYLQFAQPQIERVASNGAASAGYQQNGGPAPGYLASDMKSWFTGPLGDPQLDGIASWDGNPYFINVFQASQTTFTQAFTNLGTAPWSPVIKIRGPLNNGFTITAAYTDVDGSGQGVKFTWTGNALAVGTYLLFDTYQNRVWSVTAGVKTEVYTYTLTLPGSSNLPFPYFPQIPPGEFSLTFSYAGADGSQMSAFDLSNDGTEQFRYL